MINAVEIQDLGMQDYKQMHSRMLELNAMKENFKNQIWLLEHPPVFTQGFSGDNGNILKHTHIPIVQTDRGGQITYHGPGQLIIYPLLDLRTCNIMPLELVRVLEDTTIQWLKQLGIESMSDSKHRGSTIKRTEEKLHQ